MKTFNCPDCSRTDSCDGCPRVNVAEKQTHVPPYFPDSMIWPKDKFGVPECCRSCRNHPSNGGSGICCCSLPQLYELGGTTNG